MTLEALLSGRITHASQDGSREFITLLASISATGIALPPALIYQGDSGTLQDTWVEDWTPDQEAYFAVSSKGWSSDEIGLKWLETVFQRCTASKAGNRRRLLLVDGHSSHINMKFIDTCDSFRILLLVLPPHTTHRLQPLDVSLFAPLANYYTQGLNQLLSTSLGMVSMSKRAFWSVFWPAWQRAFCQKNIASGFEKTGVFPYNPSLVLDKITKKQPIKASTPLKTPISCRAIRRLHRVYRFKPKDTFISKLLRANERLAAEYSISQHVIKGLIEAFQQEKKRRNRGKRLNLLGEEDSGPQFFSPSRVQAAREHQAVKEEDELAKKQAIEDRKAQAVAKKKQKEEDKEKKAAALAERRRIAAEVKATKAAERQARKELKETAKQEKEEQLTLRRVSKEPSDARKTGKQKVQRPIAAIVEEEVEKEVRVTSHGRLVHRPKHLDD